MSTVTEILKNSTDLAEVKEKLKVGDGFEADDAGSAAYFAATRGDQLRFDHRRMRWLLWDGVRWAPDRDGAVTRMLVEAARERIASAVGNDSKLKKLIYAAMQSRLEAARDLAQDLHPITSVGDEWDREPMLLGVPNGVVDLRTGTLRPGRQADMITMQAAVEFHPDAKSALWEGTIADIFKDKPEGFLGYLQRALGYSLTGAMREEVFWLLLGVGRNGKGTVVNTIHYVLGDYAESLKFASLEVKRLSDGGAGPTPDLAKLHRKRFVVASEGSGAALNTALIKQITGRDPLTTRGMYARDEFTFSPEMKLWLTAQSEKRPKVKDDSEGFWARPHVVEFAQKYKGRANDKLKDELREKANAEAILAWLVRGAVEWQKGGLVPPEIVTQAAEDYRRESEPLADFYDARCVIQASCWTSSDDLRAAYLKWCEAEGNHFRFGSKRFSQEVGKRFTPYRETQGQRRHGFLGVGLQAPATHIRREEDPDVPF